MVAGASLTLALVHGFVWLRHREAWAGLVWTACGARTLSLIVIFLSIESQSGGGSTILAWVPLSGEFA